MILFTGLNIVAGWLIYEIGVGAWVVITNKESAYVPPSLMFQKAREKHLDWKEGKK